MDSDNFEKWEEKVDNLDPDTHASKVVRHATVLANNKYLSKKLIKNKNLLDRVVSE